LENGHVSARHFDSSNSVDFVGGGGEAQGYFLPPGAWYPSYATAFTKASERSTPYPGPRLGGPENK